MLRQLTRRVGELEEPLTGQVQQLSNSQLDELSEAVLDFAELGDVVVWLEAHPAQEQDEKG